MHPTWKDLQKAISEQSFKGGQAAAERIRVGDELDLVFDSHKGIITNGFPLAPFSEEDYNFKNTIGPARIQIQEEEA